MKLKAIIFALLAGLSLTAYGDDTDYSGTYIQVDRPKSSLTFQKGKNGDYQATLADIVGKNSLTGTIKNGVFYRVSDNEKVGEFKENTFILTNGNIYKKSQ